LSLHLALVVGILALHAMQSQPPSDFQFVWEYAHCHQLHRLDTRDRTLTHQALTGEVDGGPTQEPPVRESLDVRPEERQAIFTEMLRIGLFDFPTEITYPPDVQVVTVTPPSRFRLEARRNGTWTRVSWTSAYAMQPRLAHRDQLETLGRMIQNLIDSRPAVRQMPVPRACE
jgi:hypothetical protein